MTQGPFRTNYQVWVIAAVSVFVALGFVDPTAGATWKGNNSLWAHFGDLLRGDYSCSTANLLVPIMFQSLVQAVPAVVLGWVLQAFVVILWSMARNNPPGTQSAPRHQGMSAELGAGKDKRDNMGWESNWEQVEPKTGRS
jgi:hypothetical protein